MSLPHIILGLLQQEAMTGYDLKNSCFDQAIAHLWGADQSQIYRTLDKLVEQGWATCTVEIQHDRPNRKVYHLTETGRDELFTWLQRSQPLLAVREPLLVQLFFAVHLPNEKVINLLEQQLTAHCNQLNCYQQFALPSLEDSSASRQQVLHRLVLELLIQREQTYVDWLKRAIAVVNESV
jgi:PadR family transcriptional regulator, regulatory protein AphA